MGGFQPWRPAPNRRRRCGVGGPRREARSGRDTADVDGQRRHGERVRPGAAHRRQLGGAAASHRLRGGGDRGPHVRRAHDGRRRGGPRRVDLPFRRAVDRRGQKGPGCAGPGDKTMKPDFSKGLVPAVVQDADTGQVLMLAYMDEEAWSKTRESGRAWFHSRTRGLWEKGATSGNRMDVVETRLDCDADTVLLRVKPAGPACHTGAVSCFFNEPD